MIRPTTYKEAIFDFLLRRPEGATVQEIAQEIYAGIFTEFPRHMPTLIRKARSNLHMARRTAPAHLPLVYHQAEKKWRVTRLEQK